MLWRCGPAKPLSAGTGVSLFSVWTERVGPQAAALGDSWRHPDLMSAFTDRIPHEGAHSHENLRLAPRTSRLLGHGAWCAEMVDTAAGKSPGLPRSTALAAPKPLELGVPFRAASPPIAA